MRIQRANQTQAAEAGRQTSPAAGIRVSGPAVSAHPILQFQQTIGNQAVQRWLRSRNIQAKLAIGQPGDVYEREADRVAEHVMRMPEPVIQRTCSACAAGASTCSKCEMKKQALMQRKTGKDSRSADAVPGEFLHNLGAGQPLEERTRAFFEPRFGHDFSRVQVHTDSHAADAARGVRARAYTIGRDIVFGSGEYAPATMEGKRLLAHELTHVVQQESVPAAGQRPHRSAMVPFAPGAPVIQRKLECSLDHIEKECAGAATACLTAKDYCKTKYPNPKDLDKLHADAVKGANGYKEKFPNAADNLLHFLAGSGKEKVMKADIFRDHPATHAKYGEHMAKFKEGARKRLETGELKIGGPAVDLVWTDTANAFSAGGYTDLGLAVGGYTLCSKVSTKATEPEGYGKDPDFVWVRFDPWITQAFDCYNWDPGKGIGLPFATDNDLCCLENAGRAKHFRVRSDPWTAAFPPESVRKPPKKPASKETKGD